MSDMFPFTTVLNSPLPPLRNMYLVLKRSHLTVVNIATEGEKKLCFLLCLISGVLSSEEGKKLERFGNELCAMLHRKASQWSEIKARGVKPKTVFLYTIITLQANEGEFNRRAEVLTGSSGRGLENQINHDDFNMQINIKWVMRL